MQGFVSQIKIVKKVNSHPHICYTPYKNHALCNFFRHDFSSDKILNDFTDAFFLTNCKINKSVILQFNSLKKGLSSCKIILFVLLCLSQQLRIPFVRILTGCFFPDRFCKTSSFLLQMLRCIVVKLRLPLGRTPRLRMSLSSNFQLSTSLG